jgi:hypothetical protein
MTGFITMPSHHAVVFIDHHSAKIVQFGFEHTYESKVNEHLHLNGPHEKNERSRHEFFGKVCDGLEGISQVLVVGGNTSMADFRHYVGKHRPKADVQLAGYQMVNHPSNNELVALARTWFSHHEWMAAIAA